jgi:hypothetical protein
MTKQVFLINDAYPKMTYRLRWVFHWADGRVKRGMWDQSVEGCPHTSAAMQNTTGLLYACIEAMDCNSATRTVVECPGQDFKLFQWKAVQDMQMAARGGGGAKGHAFVNGLSLVSRTHHHVVYHSGIIEVSPIEGDFHDEQFQFGRDAV